LAIAQHTSRVSNSAQAPFHLRSVSCLFALTSLFWIAVPSTARADIYAWTDSLGSTNYSNVPPPKSAVAKNVKIVVTEIPRPATPPVAATTAAKTPAATPAPAEQELLARVKNLELLLLAQQQAPPPPPPSAPPAPPAPYFEAPPPSPVVYYDNPGDSGYYPAAYPDYYYYTPLPVYANALYAPRRYFARPAYPALGGRPFAGGFHGGGGRMGRR
jgi:hypothetical protein